MHEQIENLRNLLSISYRNQHALLMKIAGMFPDSTKTESLTVFQGFSQKELAALKGDDVKMLAHAEKPIEE